jgi:hypothetical protein
MSEPFRFTPETSIEEALLLDERVGQTLRSLGLKCVDKRGDWCVAAMVETFREAALYHELPLDRILEALNALQILPRVEAPPEGPRA